ncbi:MAG TPA: serine/threonine-protein kinase [Bryobacteraceae bacterium]|jgi:serine/threonine-protein kinase|nr:serine/threonine-protein kinase [Bryobacteraceae bacterium]
MDSNADLTRAETVASNSAASESPSGISHVTSVSGVQEDEGRFLPGTLLGGRYRILTLLGRGGMGEVYRAMDLTLGQSVALKFLPEEAARNQSLLERFHGEVRVARVVSHPNVCRVYDIGQVEGMPFISMEYVDGEDLASLLTRIGRLPADKAVETGRKLCAGLAAAHDRGVIHRDLKPQNIMINKRGEVVIMDFGLAAIANELTGAEARNGTPAYMSPEQIKGGVVTAKSDIYALGLVLYELFTGKRPFEAHSLQQLIDLQEAAQLNSMTSVAADIDPVVEKIIRRCLDPDPAKRPASALGVVAALPGGDPLAAALAAGETPSPEIVAAAGKMEGMPRRYSVPCLALVMLLLLATIPMRQARTALVHGGLDQSPDVLAHQGREIAASLGYPERPTDTAVRLYHREDVLYFLRHLPEPHHWDQWLSWEPAIGAVYRESPQPLVASPLALVDNQHPPNTLPGMTRTVLDGNGRLLDFTAIPRPAQADLAPPVDAATLFRAARLDLAQFHDTAPLGLPATPFDRQVAWRGPLPHFPDRQLQVEAAWWKGRIVRASILYPWEQKPAVAPAAATIDLRDVWLRGMIALAALFVIPMARRNWVRGRADRLGAFHVALASLLLQAVAWAGSFHPAANMAVFDLFVNAVAQWLFGAAVLWFCYLALEPEVRAHWPHSIVTWNRVLAGRWLDAQVGAHILIGAATGIGLWVFFKAVIVFVFRDPQPWSDDISMSAFLGARAWIGAHAAGMNEALATGLFVFMLIFAMRQFLRKDLFAALAAAVVFTLAQSDVQGPKWWLLGLLYVAVVGALIYGLLRFGLLSAIAAIFFVHCADGMALGADWNAWFTPASIATLLLLAGISIFAFWRSLGGRALLEGA